MKILIVDDHEEVRIMLRDVLQNRGHTLFCAENGNHALDVLANNTVDLIISDIIMPKMEGVEFITRVKQMRIPVISISGLPREVVVAEFFASLGIVGFLQKPFRYTELMQLVENVAVEHCDRAVKTVHNP
jgi:CheY-like chemotaxis protein